MAGFYTTFKSLNVKNVRMFKDGFTLPLENQGIVSIVGRNLDANGSNGAGKSTIFDIMRAVHLGASADGSKDIDFLANEGESSIGYVASYGPDEYEIVKHRGDKTYGNNTIVLKNGESVGYKKDTVATKKAIYSEYVKIPEAVWDNCVVLRTDKAHTLIKGTPSERVEFLTNLCGLNCYDEVYAALKERLSDVTDKIDALRESEALLADTSEQLAGQKSEDELLSEFNDKSDEKKALREYLDRKKKKLDELRARSAGCDRLVKKSSELESSELFGKTSAEVSEKLSEVRAELVRLGERKTAIEADLAAYRSYDELKKNPIGVKGDVEKLEAEYGELTERKMRLKASYEEYSEHVDAEEARIARFGDLRTADEINGEISSLEAKLAKYGSMTVEADLDAEKAELAEKQTRLNILLSLVGHEFCDCPVCGSKVSSETLKLDKAKLKKELSDAKERVAECDDEKAEFRRRKQAASDKIDECRAELDRLSEKERIERELSEYVSAHSGLEDEIEDVLPKASEAKKRLEEARRYEDYTTRLKGVLSGVTGEREELSEELVTVKSRIDELSGYRESASEYVTKKRIVEELEDELGIGYTEAEAEYDSVNVSISELSRSLGEKEGLYDTLSEEVGRLDEAVRNVRALLKKKERLEESLEKLPQLKSDKEFLTNLAYAYSANGLKAKKINAVLTAFKLRLKEYTSVLFSERDIDFDIKGDNSKFSITCVRRDASGEEAMAYDVRSLSGGEKARFVLAVVFALDDITSPSMKVNFKVLDEIDAKLDSIGKQVLLDRFIPLLKEKTSTLFIVSHDADVRDADIYDSHLVVTKKDLKSSLRLMNESEYSAMLKREKETVSR